MVLESFEARTLSGGHVTRVIASSSRAFVRHSHDEFGIGLIFEGAQRSWSGRGAVEAEVGDIITVNAGEVHDGAPIGENRSWAMLYISPEHLASLVSDISEGRHGAKEFSQPTIRNRHVADCFAAAFKATEYDDEAFDERLIFVTAGLMVDSPKVQRISQTSVAAVKARIDSDPVADHPLEELAHLAGASRFSTLRGFALETGLTPRAYVIQRRIDVARAMIRQGYTLAESAVSSGFADQSHFHRSFTRRYGLTPGAFAAATR